MERGIASLASPGEVPCGHRVEFRVAEPGEVSSNSYELMTFWFADGIQCFALKETVVRWQETGDEG